MPSENLEFLQWAVEQGALWYLVFMQQAIIYVLWKRQTATEDAKLSIMEPMNEALKTNSDVMSRVLERLR